MSAAHSGGTPESLRQGLQNCAVTGLPLLYGTREIRTRVKRLTTKSNGGRSMDTVGSRGVEAREKQTRGVFLIDLARDWRVDGI